MVEGLLVEDLHAGYGRFEVVRGIDLEINPGEITAIFGHNGAGKTTTLRTIAGLQRPMSGTIQLDGQDVTRASAAGRARLGLALVPDGARGVFPNLSVAQNLQLAHSMGRPRTGRGSDVGNERADALLDELFGDVLRARTAQKAWSLSGGERQMLALSLAIARNPTSLLLDEPSLGLAPRAVERLMAAIGVLRQRLGTAILIVEQDIGPVLTIADRVSIMKSGRLVTSMAASECPPPQDLWHFF
jgi:branched-chain amino acid transport system ATP-binding protein